MVGVGVGAVGQALGRVASPAEVAPEHAHLPSDSVTAKLAQVETTLGGAS
jgi:hypothetical protein